MRAHLEELGLIARQLRRVYQTWRGLAALMRRFPAARIDPSVNIVSPELLDLGEGVALQYGAHLHCGGRSWSQGAGHIRIGARGVISPYCILYGAGGIQIGDDFDCGPGSMIFSSRSRFGLDEYAGAQQHRFAEVTIGAGVIVYAGCIIGPGVTIGDRAVIGAGSVVLDDVPPSTLYAGAPARLIRRLDHEP